MALHLEVRQHLHTCEFQLTWGEGQQLPPATVPYPTALIDTYQRWQRHYLNFYRSFRGRVVGAGGFSDVEDRRSQLVKAEAELLTEFHEWLRSKPLDDIRRQIAQLARERSEQAIAQRQLDSYLTIFLICGSLDLERLPWGAWEIGNELGSSTTIRVARSPDKIRATPIRSCRRGRNRVLVILGDDTGLDFKQDRQAVQGLSGVADIHFMGWQPGQDPTSLLTQITQAITDPQGWDLLLFAGHSNESATSGGELSIAPNLTVAIHELVPYLQIAREHGLQFALFNSCSGTSIARALIDLGFNQVAVMREPVHNQVAQEFLVQFLRSMAQYKDVHEALLTASKFLRLEKNLTYPSSALVPSLYCRPGQQLFQFRKFGWAEWLRLLMPTPKQAVALAAVTVLSLLTPVQGTLLEQRQWTQSVYRRLTGQMAESTVQPIALVEIDVESIQRAAIANPNPMDRSYLAKLIEQLAELEAPVIGVDYLFDRPAAQPVDDLRLGQALETAAAQGVWLVLPSIQSANGEWSQVLPATDFSTDLSHWSLVGDIDLWGHERGQHLLPTYLRLPLPGSVERHTPLPFSYLLALAAQSRQETATNSPRPNVPGQTPLVNQIAEQLAIAGKHHSTSISPRSRLQTITLFSFWLRQLWLHPVIDYSLPPNQVYQSIPAWQLLEEADAEFNFQNTVVILAAGGYNEAGILPGEDTMALPAALRHWRFWEKATPASLEFMTGGEAHAYMLHNFLARRLVVPIPDLWMVGVAVLVGTSTGLVLQKLAIRRRHGYLLLLGTTVIYGVISLQLYIAAAVLLPWFLPSLTFWICAVPKLKESKLTK
jgi:CHASE2 domain-containing sensor protein